jgi:hypothetical protein
MAFVRRTHGFALVAFASSSLVALSPASAERTRADRISIDGRTFDRIEVRVSDFSASKQANVALDMSAHGDIVAVWDSRRQQDGNYGVYARWLSSDGTLRGKEEQLNLHLQSMQVGPGVSLDRDGQPWFTWTSYGQDGSQGGIVGRSVGDEVLVNTATAGDQGNPVAAQLTDGNRVVVWSTPGENEPESRIAYRIFDRHGAPLCAEATISSAAGLHDRVPSVAAAADGSFLVAWGRSTTDGEILGVFARRFTADGTPLGDAFSVSEPGADNIEPAVAANASGSYAISWMRLDPETDYDVMVRRVNAAGELVGPPVCAQADRTGWQSGGAVAMAPDGRFAVAWNTNGDRDQDVFVRFFDADGTPQSADVRVNRCAEGRQFLAQATGTKRIALADDGRLAVAWEGNSDLGDDTAANVTILAPAARGVGGAVSSLFGKLTRSVRNTLTRDEAGEIHLEATAMPHVPPSFDAGQVTAQSQPDVVQRGGELGFDAFTNTGWVPPDPHVAVGPDHVLAIVNGGVRVFSKATGASLWFLDINGAAGFWGPVGAGDAGGFVFDSEVIWDVLSDRYIAMANERSGGRSYFLLAVSHTTDASDPDNWHKYRLDVTAIAGGDIDSPQVAVDANYIYLTADFFSPDAYLIVNILKSSVLGGGAPTLTTFLRIGTQSFGVPSMYTSDAPRMYMIEHFDTEPSSTLRLWSIENPGGGPSIVSTNLTVPTYYNPGDSRSGGTSAVVELFECRFWSCMYRDGSLWACHHISLDNSPRLAVARWYEIHMNGWPTSGNPPTLNQSGTVTAASDVYLTFNSIFADASGNAMMVFARSGLSEFYSIARVFRLGTDPLGVMHGPDFVKQSTTAYGSNRWGDYSAVVSDPSSPGRFWMHHEYAPGWRTWIQSETVGGAIAVGDVTSTTPANLHISPSPTSGPTSFRFSLAAEGHTTLEIYTASGQLVRAMDLGTLGATTHFIDWDGRDEGGQDVAAGAYLTRIVSNGAAVADGRLIVTR